MGLDMYLFRVHKNRDKTFRQTIKSKNVSFENIGYWRKANAIHYWFVENIQNGVDNCEYYKVSQENLEDLLVICNKVLDSIKLVNGFVNVGREYTKDGGWRDIVESGKVVKDTTIAKELLPTADGFFFGSTDYDEYYVEHIKNTKKIINDILNNFDFENNYVVYMSSW